MFHGERVCQAQVSFTIAGKICSANRVTRRVGGRSVKSAEARHDVARVRGLALAAKFSSGWAVPAADRPVALEIVAWNSRLDAGNVEKVIADGLKGVLIVDDGPRYLRRLVVEHCRDGAGERYAVTVSSLDAAGEKA